LALIYVEYVRNIPLLAHLFVIYAALQALPPIRSALSIGGVAFLSNRGLAVPAAMFSGSWVLLGGALLAGLLLAIAAQRFAHIRQQRTGHRPRVLPIVLGSLVGLPLIASLLQGATFDLDMPRRAGFNFVGGTTISPELTALLAGLVLYFGAFIAEIVRGGILAVSQGQWQAGNALGLTRSRVLRLVVLPQALRLIIPATTNQYLDLAKSSSLAIAIGYPDLVAVINGIITDTGQALEGVAIIMGAFVLLNLSISALMNWYNARVRLVER
jgi:general L-amino acid transport system permease protein